MTTVTTPSAVPTTYTILDASRVAYAAGLCVIPVRQDGSKAPDLDTWAEYQAERPGRQRMRVWFRNRNRHGMAVVCGAVSGHLEGIDFDDATTFESFMEAARATGLGEIVERIEAGYSERSPKGAPHWLYRCSAVGHNTKLAQRPAPTRENPHGRLSLIETRGEGGYLVVAPSHGAVHASGQPYELLRGGFDTIGTITTDEREALFCLMRSFDEMPVVEYQPQQSPGSAGGERPGDDFNARATWEEVLGPHGWQVGYRRGEKVAWKRPGKTEPGISATTNHAGSNLLYVFSSNTSFEPERGYSKFSAYALLSHGRDYAAAAKALAARGYGERRPGSTNERTNPEEPRGDGVSSSKFVRSSEALLPVPAFPTHLVPGVAGRLIEEAAASHGCPPEFVALPLLSNVGAMLGRSVAIEVKRGFREYAIIWGVVVGDPGSGKSPASNTARHGLDVLQEKARQEFDIALKEFEGTIADWHAGKPGTRGAKPARPVMRHYFSTDSTTEAVASMLTHSPGFTLFRDEITGWVRSFDQYRGGRGADRQNWLSAWSASPLKVDRKGGDPIVIAHPVVTVSGGVQPEMLSELADEAGRRDGFIERFLWAYPDASAQLWSEAEVTLSTLQAIEKLFDDLRPVESSPAANLQIVTFSDTARARWREWYDENALDQIGSTGMMAGVSAKMPLQVLRLALILHCLKRPSEPAAETLSAETLEAAFDLGDYFLAHAGRTLAIIGPASATGTNKLRGRIRRALRRADGDDGWMTTSALHSALGGHVRGNDLRDALAQMVADLDVAQRDGEVSAAGGRPADYWRWNQRTREEV